MSYLDTNLSISFISESGKEATFYPVVVSEFIDYLEECEPGIIQHLFTNENTISQEIVNFLQESIYFYLEEHPNKYNPELSSFIIENSMSEMYITIQEDEDEIDEIIGETISDFISNEGFALSILENIDDLIQEISAKKMVRGGKIIRRIDCPPGSKLVSGRCVRMGSTELRKRMKAALKATKTRRKHMMNKSFANAIMKKRKKSMKLGSSRGVY